jgi:acetyl esterase
VLEQVLERLAPPVLKAPLPFRWLAPVDHGDAGVRLDPQVAALVRMLALVEDPFTRDLSLAQARASMERTGDLLAPRRAGVLREDRVFPGPAGPLRARLYVPRGALAPAGLLVYFHGGGWVLGSIDSHDGVCAALAHDAGIRVLSVDYRLAPEAPFPAAVDDALASFRWARDQAAELGGDPTRVAVGGDSAGGNLAAVVAQLAKADPEGGPRFQLLVYPSTDNVEEAASFETCDGYLLARDRVRWFRSQYLPDLAQRADPRASPLRFEDLSGAAPALVQTGGFDVLRDEGEVYGERLRAAGVATEVRRYGALPHGYLNLAGAVRAARRPLADAAAALRWALERPPTV